MESEVTFTEQVYEVAKKQCLYWLENGNDAEEVALWLNIVFTIEDRMQQVVIDLDEEDPEE